jgi:antitoxin HicB
MKSQQTRIDTKSKQHINLPAIFQPEPEGGFTVIVPSLPGCITFGKTLDEAKLMIREAIMLYVEDIIDDGEKLPETISPYLSSIEITLPQTQTSRTVHA